MTNFLSNIIEFNDENVEELKDSKEIKKTSTVFKDYLHNSIKEGENNSKIIGNSLERIINLYQIENLKDN